MFGKRLDRLETALRKHDADVVRYHDEHYGIQTCHEALAAVRSDNYGVGALIVGPGGDILVRASNGVFGAGFRSDRHAEMRAMTTFEEGYGRQVDAASCTLYTSLEPCPMCLARLKLSGIGRVRYLAPDPDGGMVHLVHRLPPIWAYLNTYQDFAPAEVSPALGKLAKKIFLSNIHRMRRRLLARA